MSFEPNAVNSQSAQSVNMQGFLFDEEQPRRYEFGDGGLWYFPHWLTDERAWQYFESLRSECGWQQSTIRLAGRDVKIPRLNAWYGDLGTDYRYSNTAFEALPWILPLKELQQALHKQLESMQRKERFNSALVNCYRDGNDSVAWHADDEPELGKRPLIASISFGAQRRFLLKRRSGGDSVRLELAHGSLLLMLPPLQANWLHCLPKTKSPLSARINVTFRHVAVH